MSYEPGNNWCICDLTGRKVLMSQTRKTWDGLRVWEKVWYQKNPQQDLRAIPDHMAVIDGRSRTTDVYTIDQYGWGTFCLVSPDGTNWVVTIDNEGAIFVTAGTWGLARIEFHIGHYGITVDNDGALHVADIVEMKNADPWKLYTVAGDGFNLTVDTDLALLVTAI
jgi:hypothetical protein